MRPYGQYCPIARAAELLGDRWTLLIVRELVLGAHGFNEIERGLPRISRGLLAQRLRDMESAGLLTRAVGKDGRGAGYALTPAGRELEELLWRMGEWGARWAFGEPREEELDARLLLWWICRRIEDGVDGRRAVVRVDFADDRSWYWLVLERRSATVCLQAPGFDVDVELGTDLRTLYQVWLGRLPLAAALREGSVRLQGVPGAVRGFRALLSRLSPIAGAVREAVAGA